MESDSPLEHRWSPRHSREKDLQVILLVSDVFREVLDYRTYCLTDKMFRYRDEVALIVAKILKRLGGPLKLQMFDLFNPVFIHRFSSF